MDDFQGLGITPEQARAELMRRQAGRTALNEGITAPQAKEELSRRLNPNFSLVKDYAIPAGAGALNEILSSLASVGNLGLELGGSEKRIPYPNLKKHLKESPETNIGYKAGEIGSYFIPVGGQLRGLEALNALFRPAGKLGLASDIGKGAAFGYATQERENEEGQIDQNRRKLGAAAGAAGNLIAQSLPKTLGQRVLKNKKDVENKYGELYENLFNSAEGSGREVLKNPPKINLNKFKGSGYEHIADALNDFYKNPTLRNAHRSQSELFKISNKLSGGTGEARGLVGNQLKAFNEATRARKEVRNFISRELDKEGNKDLANIYEKLTEGYRKEVVPYFGPEVLEKAARGKAYPSSIPSKLYKDEEFMLALGKLYPELLAYSPAAKGAFGTAGLLGFGEHYLKKQPGIPNFEGGSE